MGVRLREGEVGVDSRCCWGRVRLLGRGHRIAVSLEKRRQVMQALNLLLLLLLPLPLLLLLLLL